MKKTMMILSLVLMSSTVFANQYHGIYECFADQELTNKLDVIYEVKDSQAFVNGNPFDLTANRTIPENWASTSSGQLDRVNLVKVVLNGGTEDIKFCKLTQSNGALYPMGHFIPNGQ